MSREPTFDEVLRAAQGGDVDAQELISAVFEESGRPDEAVRWMAQAAKSGRASAWRQLGLWQIVGYGTPSKPAEGFARLRTAADAGDVQAMTMCGVITAGGVGVPRSVDEAVSWLLKAARAGEPRALCQVALLVGLDGGDADIAETLLQASARAGFDPARSLRRAGQRSAPTLDWGRIEAALTQRPLDSPIVSQTRREAPLIRLVDDLLPGWACDYVRLLAAPRLQRGKVVVESGDEDVRDERSNRVMNFGLSDSDILLELINNRIAEAAGMPAENAEGLGVLHYAPGERYAPHVDYIPDTPQNAQHLAQRGQRVRTLLVYLNEGFEGGATEFPRLGLSFKPPRGSALIFDSVTPDGQVDPLTLHTGAPPTAGEKWVISKWFR
ncbi:MAG: 2OG-Fe(II) oxygenase, partial [Caulobacteraceae bacterium]|nr:2OG-Fe(II) oxygenase [Caulobacteraceae bacterium]